MSAWPPREPKPFKPPKRHLVHCAGCGLIRKALPCSPVCEACFRRRETALVTIKPTAPRVDVRHAWRSGNQRYAVVRYNAGEVDLLVSNCRTVGEALGQWLDTNFPEDGPAAEPGPPEKRNERPARLPTPDA